METTKRKVSKKKKEIFIFFFVYLFFSPFPIVAEAIQEELERYRQSEDEVKRLKTAMGIKGDAEDLAISMLNDTTSKLTNAVSSLPELLEKKRLLDSHTNIATALLDHIKVINNKI